MLDWKMFCNNCILRKSLKLAMNSVSVYRLPHPVEDSNKSRMLACYIVHNPPRIATSVFGRFNLSYQSTTPILIRPCAHLDSVIRASLYSFYFKNPSPNPYFSFPFFSKRPTRSECYQYLRPLDYQSTSLDTPE